MRRKEEDVEKSYEYENLGKGANPTKLHFSSF